MSLPLTHCAALYNFSLLGEVPREMLFVAILMLPKHLPIHDFGNMMYTDA